MSAQEKDRVKSFPSDVGAILKRVCKGGRSSCLGKGQKGPKMQIFDQSILANVKQMFPCSKKDCRTIHHCAKVYIFQGKWKITPEIYWNLCKKYENMVYVAGICIYILYQF